jgi:IS5 family transposase
MMAGRYAHAKQFNRHHRQLRLLRIRLGRIIRDIRRKIAGKADLEALFEWPLVSKPALDLSDIVRQPRVVITEASCVKASIATTNARAPGGQFVLHARTLPSNPYDSHTLGVVIAARSRAYVDKGYRGHRAANPRRVFMSGQKRGVFGLIKRELRRRCAIEVGHMKTDGHLGRCHLKGRQGDAANVILTAVGHNLRLILAWLRALCRLVVLALLQAFATPSALKSAS